MKKYNLLYCVIKYIKTNLIFILVTNSISLNGFCGEVSGIYIPQGKFDSALPTVTMHLDQINPPVIRIAPSRPTVVIFPNQVSSCFSDNAALMTEIANATKLNPNEQGVTFSSVVFKVIGKVLKNGEIPDQTVANCQLIDSNVYPIGVIFTDTNAYSVVKLLNVTPSTSSFSFDMEGYSAIRIGEKSHKIKDEKIENNVQDTPKNLIPIKKKVKTMDELMKENYPQLKKEDLTLVDNNKQKKEVNSSSKIQDNNEFIHKEGNVKKSNLDKNVSIAQLLEEKGFKSLKGE
jgi:hypothetical protein